jgi:hypothetical protein
MSRISWKLSLNLAIALLLLGTAQRASAQVIVRPANVSYYYPAPVVSYYNPPVAYAPVQQVSYYSAPPVTYTPSVAYYQAPPVTYAAPAVSYYAPRAVSYYAAPVSAVTTTRYGLFGRPRETNVYYYPR